MTPPAIFTPGHTPFQKLMRSAVGLGQEKKRYKKERAPVAAISNAPTRTLASKTSGFPQQQRRTLNLYYFRQLNLGTVTYGEDTCTLNGLFDPTSIGATQPIGFAKYMAIYTKAYVVKCKWRVQFGCATSTGTNPSPGPIQIGATVTTNTNNLNNVETAIGVGLCQYGYITASNDTKKMEGVVDIGKFLDRKSVKEQQDLYSTVAANPSQIVVLHIWGQNPGPTTVQMATQVLLEFDVIFTDPQPFT